MLREAVNLHVKVCIGVRLRTSWCEPSASKSCPPSSYLGVNAKHFRCCACSQCALQLLDSGLLIRHHSLQCLGRSGEGRFRLRLCIRHMRLSADVPDTFVRVEAIGRCASAGH